MGDFQGIIIAAMVALAAVGAIVVASSWYLYVGWMVPVGMYAYGYRTEALWAFGGWVIGAVIVNRFGRSI